MSSLVLLPIALVIVLLSYPVVMPRRELRVLKRTVGNHLRAHIDSVAAYQAEDSEEWAPGVLDVGGLFPGAADRESAGEWQVVLLVKAGCQSCGRVLAELKSITDDLPPGYGIAVAAASFVGVGPLHGVATLQLDEVDAVPTPALVLLDPGGTIQGRGAASTAASIISFVEEGLDHGYGPAALVEARSADSERSAGAHARHAHAQPTQLETHGLPAKARE